MSKKRFASEFTTFYSKDSFSDEPKFARFDRYGRTLYLLEDVKRLEKSWKDDFRKKNRTDEVEKMIGIDKAYEEFCKEIDDFIAQNERP
jgi:hypothetical protein